MMGGRRGPSLVEFSPLECTAICRCFENRSYSTPVILKNGVGRRLAVRCGMPPPPLFAVFVKMRAMPRVNRG